MHQQLKKPSKEELEYCVEAVRIHILTLTQKAMQLTGLSESFCRDLVIRDMARRRGMKLPAQPESQGGETASTPLANGD